MSLSGARASAHTHACVLRAHTHASNVKCTPRSSENRKLNINAVDGKFPLSLNPGDDVVLMFCLDQGNLTLIIA